MAATQGTLRPRGEVGRTRALATDRGRVGVGAVPWIVAGRRPLPWLGMLGLPLGVCAAVVGEQWWAIVPLTICAWWWAPRDWGWEWVTAIQTGLVGSAWAAAGALALGEWPRHRPVIAAVWIGSALLLAGATALLRWQARRR